MSVEVLITDDPIEALFVVERTEYNGHFHTSVHRTVEGALRQVQSEGYYPVPFRSTKSRSVFAFEKGDGDSLAEVVVRPLGD